MVSYLWIKTAQQVRIPEGCGRVQCVKKTCLDELVGEAPFAAVFT